MTSRASAGTRGKKRVVTVGDGRLSIDDVAAVARGEAEVAVTPDAGVRARVERAHEFAQAALDGEPPVYGVTTRFGGMADRRLASDAAVSVQNTSLWTHKTGTGRVLPREAVRAAMLLRIQSHLRGHSGVRMELVERLLRFLNDGATPRAREFGSIGASGDLVPLNYICGCVVGASAGFEVEFRGEVADARDVLAELGLEPLELRAKESLAMMNGTSFSAGMAALFFSEARTLFAGALAFHALAIQALAGRRESFDPFIHGTSRHPGQQWVAGAMFDLLRDSRLCADSVNGGRSATALVQDRYSIRCLPQYLGPLAEDLALSHDQIEAEANGCSDNPLIDAASGRAYHGGNFLGQYVAQAVDRLRYALAMMGKHIDVQIALLMAPEFSNGLPASLVGNPANSANMGLKGLQLTGNSIVPLLLHRAAPVADRFPTHAEQFNQNLNSQSFAACLLCAESTHAFRHYLAVALLISIQAVDLRAALVRRTHDPRDLLSPLSRGVYEAVREAVGRPPSPNRPYAWNDDDQAFDRDVERVVAGLAPGAGCSEALGNLGIEWAALRAAS